MSISSDQNAAGTVAGGSPDEAQLLKDFRETRKPGEVTKSYLGGVRETLKETVGHILQRNGSIEVANYRCAAQSRLRGQKVAG